MKRRLCRNWCWILLFLKDEEVRFGISSATWGSRPSRQSFVVAATLDAPGDRSSLGYRRHHHSSRRRDSSNMIRKRRSNSDTTTGTTTNSDDLWDDEFVPLVFSEDESEEEQIVAALATVEEDETETRRPRKMLYDDRRSNKDSIDSSSSDVMSQAEESMKPANIRDPMAPSVPSKTENNLSPVTQQQGQRHSSPSRRQSHPEDSVRTSNWHTRKTNNPHTYRGARVAPGGPIGQSVPSKQTPIPPARMAGGVSGTRNAPPISADYFSNSASQRGVSLPNTPSSLNGSSRYAPTSQAAAYRSSTTSSLPQAAQFSQSNISQSRQACQQQQQVDQHPTTTTTPWIRRFLSSRPKDALLPIPRSYLSDCFNLVQLAPIVEKIALGADGYSDGNQQHKQSSFPYYKAGLRLILEETENSPTPVPAVQRAAEVLYLLVHARYVISPRGLDTVRRVMKTSVEPVFGRCPRFGCRGMPLLPYGESDDVDLSANSNPNRAKRYCCCCGEKLIMWESRVDGCAWGPSFCHLFLMTYGEELFPGLIRIADTEASTEKSTTRIVTPSIFGFKLHPSCKARYPRRVVLESSHT